MRNSNFVKSLSWNRVLAAIYQRQNCNISRRLSSQSENRIRIVEVGPRDGLQNEKTLIPTRVKQELIYRLLDAGVNDIEVTSFVSAKWVPQMSDAEELCLDVANKCSSFFTQSHYHSIALTPNIKGLDKALHLRERTEGCVPKVVAIFAAASEGFSKANINCSISESFDRFRPVLEKAAKNNMPVRGYVSCVIACPYDGPTPPDKVAHVAEQLHKMGCYEISLGDTIGMGNPQSTNAMLNAVVQRVPANQLALHFHDTYGKAIENIAEGLKFGVRVVDSSIAGLGGCPYAGPGAPGNVDTARVVRYLHEAGYQTGIDLEKLDQTAMWIREHLRNMRAKL